MFKITDLGGREIYLNTDLVEKISGGANTVITLLNGTNIVAKERPEELIERIAAFKRLCNDKASIEIVHRMEGEEETARRAEEKNSKAN